jgi:hypothetical protein
MMKNYLIVLYIAIIFCSCKPSPVKQSLSAADSLVIHFKDEQAAVVTRTVQTAESNAIRRIIDFIDAKETELFKCGYDGKIIQEVDFKMKNESCNHFAFLLNGKLVSTRMKNEAVDFLDALERGMPYY